MTENEHFGKTILLQIGGVNKLKSSVGAYNFIMLNRGVSFRLKNPRANYIKVVLSNMDLYDVEIGMVDSTSYKIVKMGYGIYNDALKEFNVDLKLDSLETLQLKKPNQVYFELYKEARNKAKMAKKNAILAYLEAKNIKKTYLVENINDSDSDFDAEIDDVSESELEGL